MTDLRKYELSSREKALFYAAVCAAGLVISYLMYRSIIFSVVIIPLIPRLESYVKNELAIRRRRRYMLEFKDFLFIASTSIGAGMSMKDAIGEAIPSLRNIHGEDSILAAELTAAHERMTIGGESDVTVLADLAAASGLEDVYDFVTVYSICKKTGASLIIALSKAASVIIDKITIERETEEMVRRKETEGMIIFCTPVLVILFLNLFSPAYIAPMYETLAGRLIMTGVVASAAGIYGVIQKIIKVDI